MISLEDCLGLCGLTEEEVLAIAEHERVPEIVATSIASTLMQRSDGAATVRDIIRDDIREAARTRDFAHAKELLGVLRHFLEAHPELVARQTPIP